MSGKKRLIQVLLLVLVIGASFFIGHRIGKNDRLANLTPLPLENQNPPGDVAVDFSSFWKAWRVVDEKFTPSSTSTTDLPSNQERVWGAISGMVQSLGDPYTVFLPPEEAKIFESDIAGNFEGVGMEIGIQEGVLTVISPLKNSPAARAGIKAGDKIVAIDGSSTENMSTDQAVLLIRGKVGTKVKLTVLREGKTEPLDISVTRAVVNIPTIESSLRGDGIYDIKLFNFSATSPDQFRTALRQFVRTGSNKLILDLRGNPGGFLEAAVDMASWFLPTGAVVVREEYRDGRDQVVHRSRGYDIFGNNLKMVILMDRGSASAAEILAGALQENGIATLVGENSFGKGSVQELVKITADSSLKVTIAQWLTPNGRSISAGGLRPDIEAKMTDKDVAAGRDPQLAAAVEFLLKK